MQWGRPGQGPGQERAWGSPEAEEVHVDRGWRRRGVEEMAGSRGSRLGLRIPWM